MSVIDFVVLVHVSVTARVVLIQLSTNFQFKYFLVESSIVIVSLNTSAMNFCTLKLSVIQIESTRFLYVDDTFEDTTVIVSPRVLDTDFEILEYIMIVSFKIRFRYLLYETDEIIAIVSLRIR